jgi:hypothetical protein
MRLCCRQFFVASTRKCERIPGLPARHIRADIEDFGLILFHKRIEADSEDHDLPGAPRFEATFRISVKRAGVSAAKSRTCCAYSRSEAEWLEV